jgi:alpha-tubulin suppressor-like RCC1 family protein
MLGGRSRTFRLASLGIGLTVSLVVLGGFAPASESWASAKPAKLAVLHFAATPYALASSGGSVTLSAQVANATSCVFSSKPVATGLPATVACSSGTVTENVVVPANTGGKAARYTFYLSVSGSRTIEARPLKFTVMASLGGSAIALAAGGDHTCGVLGGGTVACWGFNENSEVGNGKTRDVSTPVTVRHICGATAVTTGTYHTCALLARGTIDCWGQNYSGQLGNGTTATTGCTCSKVPVTVSGITGAIAVAAGGEHTCALLAGGTLDCWGSNYRGDLGNGTITDSSTPVAVSGLTGSTGLAAGNVHTCALLTGGAVDCWGDGYPGQLGSGRLQTNSTTPVSVIALA